MATARTTARRPRPTGARPPTSSGRRTRSRAAPRPAAAVATVAVATVAPPRPPTLFVGRDRELGLLERGLTRVPVEVVCGLAGVGKSSLAYAVAAPELRARCSATIAAAIRSWRASRSCSPVVAGQTTAPKTTTPGPCLRSRALMARTAPQ